MVIYTARKGVINLKSNPLGKGGQGKVYKVTNKPMLVAKLFHPQHCTKKLEQKIKLMVANPPLNKQNQHTYFAWPTEVAYDNSGNFIGYLMPELVNMKSIYSVLHPKLKPKGFSWHYSITTASNLARTVELLHKHGYIVGDLNESNIMVSSGALVSVLDCDSMQIKDVNGNTIYHCEVKKDDYLPPELQDIDLKNHTRYEYHDNFSLAVLIFQLLMNGTNPYFGSGARTPKENIKNNYTFVIDKNIKPPAGTPPLDILPDDVLNIFKACFANGFHNPSSRPSPKEWIKILQNLEANIVKCPQNHSYSTHLNSCPWCSTKIKLTATQKQNKPIFQKPSPPPAPQQNLVPQKQYYQFNNRDVFLSVLFTALVYGGLTAGIGISFWTGFILAPLIFGIMYAFTELDYGRGWAIFWGTFTPAIVTVALYLLYMLLLAIWPILLIIFVIVVLIKSVFDP